MIITPEKETAQRLNVSTRTLQRHRQKGTGPKFVRICDRKIGYTDEAIRDYLCGRTFASTAAEYAAASKAKAANRGDRTDIDGERQLK